MTLTSRRARFVACVAALAIALASSAVPARAQTLPKLRIVVVPTEIADGMVNAAQLGYFKDAGIDAEIIPLTNGGSAASAVISGAADIAFSNSLSVIVAHDKGLPVTIVVGADLHRAASPDQGLLAVPKASVLRSGKDFNGKTIGVPTIGSTQYYAVRKWIDSTGGDSTTVRFAELPNPTIADAIVAGRVDAGSIDILSLNARRASLRQVASTFDAIAPRFLAGVWFSTVGWVQKNPDLARKFVAVYTRYAAWANSHPADEISFYAKFSGLAASDLQAVQRPTFEPLASLDLMQPVIDVAASYGAIGKTFRAGELLSPAGRPTAFLNAPGR
jgi:NitT/TauT family transport system substrate-binding protein